MRLINKNIHWVTLALILIVSAAHAYTIHYMFGFVWNIAIADCLCSMLMLSLSIWTIILLIKAYPTKVTLYTYSLLIALALSVGTVFADWNILKWWVKPNTDTADYLGWAYYIGWLEHSLPIRFLITWIFYSWIASNSALRKNINELNTRFQHHTDAAVLLRDAELFKLRQQLQPHFLYNSLNSISALVMISPDKAQEMIGKLSDFLRSSVKREAEDKIPVNEELVYIESYLAIESVRFGDRLQVRFDKRYNDHATIPPFLFQPILENAIKFGLYSKTGTVEITISIVSEGGVLTLAITNPYDPNMQPLKGTGFGLEGVGRRLYLLYARTDLLETQKDDTNFTTILKIPQNNV